MVRIREKAEFFGSCQWCGNHQKLPGGKLAKHGYDIKWGFFNGVCRGAGYLPYEQSCDLVKKSIEEITEQMHGILTHVNNIEKSTSSEVMADIRITMRGKTSYQWVKGKLEKKVTGDGLILRYLHPISRQEETYVFNFYDMDYAKTVDAGVKSLNKKYADYLRGEAKKMRAYIVYQQERVDNWKKKELFAVDPNNAYVRPDRPASTRKNYVSKSPDGKREETAKTSKPYNFAVWGLTKPSTGYNDQPLAARWRFLGWCETQKQADAKKFYYTRESTGFGEYSEVRILSVQGA